MTKINILWDPKGVQLDTVGPRSYMELADGDTPYVKFSIRMLSIDTPEKRYKKKSSNFDNAFDDLSSWINQGKAPISDDLAGYLLPRISTGSVGSLQEQQAIDATSYFDALIKNKLTKPNGKLRKLFLKTADESFDSNGRLLAYVSPYYSSAELNAISYEDRATFNLLMVESGWAASFPIYPSLPKHVDLELFHSAAKKAFDGKKGAWGDDKMLTGYEFRMCVKLYYVTKRIVNGENLKFWQKYGWIDRYCCDLSNRKVYFPQDYFKVKPYNRVFIWSKDVSDAVSKLNLFLG